MKISVLIPVKEGGLPAYKAAFRSLMESCSDARKVEFLVKVDSIGFKRKCERFLSSTGVSFKVVYSKISGYKNIPKYCNQMANVATGDLYWAFGDDCTVSGDWVRAFLKTRNTFKDNIYIINTRPWAHICFAPVVSREWYKTLGYFAPYGCPVDTWLRDLARKVGRYVDVKGVNVLRGGSVRRNVKSLRRRQKRQMQNSFPGALLTLTKAMR